MTQGAGQGPDEWNRGTDAANHAGSSEPARQGTGEPDARQRRPLGGRADHDGGRPQSRQEPEEAPSGYDRASRPQQTQAAPDYATRPGPATTAPQPAYPAAPQPAVPVHTPSRPPEPPAGHPAPEPAAPQSAPRGASGPPQPDTTTSGPRPSPYPSPGSEPSRPAGTPGSQPGAAAPAATHTGALAPDAGPAGHTPSGRPPGRSAPVESVAVPGGATTAGAAPPTTAPVSGAPAEPAKPTRAPEPQPVNEPREPSEYTATKRDIPVVDQHSAEHEPTLLDTPAPAAEPSPSTQGQGPLFVVGDVHGYLDELCAALRAAQLIDADNHWIAGNSRLWFLGDFTDRGPDGIGVIDLVMHLSAEAAAAGGYCKALMGNHELLLIGAKRFGETPVNSGAGTASFQAAWLLNGGQSTDMERLQDHHLQWMSRLDAMAVADNHLLVHSDASCYLDYGDTVESVNDAVTEALQRCDADETWDLFRRFTKRFAFRDEGSGATAARELLDMFGGERIVHGHSPIPYLLDEVGSEDEDSAPTVTGPHVYADGLAIAMDGGVTMAGKLLVAQLPLAGKPATGQT